MRQFLPRNVAAVAAAVLIAIIAALSNQGGNDRGSGDRGNQNAGRSSRAPGGEVPAKVEGSVRLVDGDSFFIAGGEVRLVGIDAPEGKQDCQRDGRSWPCGRESHKALERQIAGRPISCAVEEADQHGRFLAVCSVGGTELNRWMVEQGWAVSYGRYKAEEARARSQKRGLWSGSFERPRDWRDRNNR